MFNGFIYTPSHLMTYSLALKRCRRSRLEIDSPRSFVVFCQANPLGKTIWSACNGDARGGDIILHITKGTIATPSTVQHTQYQRTHTHTSAFGRPFPSFRHSTRLHIMKQSPAAGVEQTKAASSVGGSAWYSVSPGCRICFLLPVAADK